MVDFSAKTCEMVPNGTNTELVPPGLVLSFMETYTYQCLPGYTSFGDMCAVCLANGNLSIAAPDCTGT